MNRLANITLLCYLLWVVIFNILGKPETWELGYYISESLFMAFAVLFMAVGVQVRRWLAIEVGAYLIFRIVFVCLMEFIPFFELLNDNIWFMRLIGVVLLSVIFINKKR